MFLKSVLSFKRMFLNFKFLYDLVMTLMPGSLLESHWSRSTSRLFLDDVRHSVGRWHHRREGGCWLCRLLYDSRRSQVIQSVHSSWMFWGEIGKWLELVPHCTSTVLIYPVVIYILNLLDHFSTTGRCSGQILLKCWRSEQCWFASNNYLREQFEISTDNRSIFDCVCDVGNWESWGIPKYADDAIRTAI